MKCQTIIIRALFVLLLGCVCGAQTRAKGGAKRGATESKVPQTAQPSRPSTGTSPSTTKPSEFKLRFLGYPLVDASWTSREAEERRTQGLHEWQIKRHEASLKRLGSSTAMKLQIATSLTWAGCALFLLVLVYMYYGVPVAVENHWGGLGGGLGGWRLTPPMVCLAAALACFGAAVAISSTVDPTSVSRVENR